MSESSEGLLSKVSGARKLITLVLLIAACPFMLSCYGHFPLTRAVYRANGSVPNDVLKSVVMWVFIIIPVYSVAMLADAVIFNLIEFWTGTKIRISSATDEQGNRFVLDPSEDGREALLSISQDGDVVARVRFVKVSETLCEVRSADGDLAGTAVRTPGGDIELTDAQGRVVATIPASQLAVLNDT